MLLQQKKSNFQKFFLLNQLLLILPFFNLKLSDLYKAIKGLDARQHLKEFADKLNITNVDLEEYGYNDKSFSRSMNRSNLKGSRGGMLQTSFNTSALGKSRLKASQNSEDLEKITEENQGGESIDDV